MVDRFQSVIYRLVVVGLLLFAIALPVGGCGVINIERTVFPAQITDADGNPIFIEDIQAITQNPDLSAEGMTTALRDLGIENDLLIQAIIADSLSG